MAQPPNGVFIAAGKFGPPPAPLPPLAPPAQRFPTYTGFPFPNATNSPSGLPLPYIGFDYLGRLAHADGTPWLADEYIPLARGSIFYARGPNGNFINLRPTSRKVPPVTPSAPPSISFISTP